MASTMKAPLDLACNQLPGLVAFKSFCNSSCN